MKIAIDVSQIAYEGTGVANYTKELVENLLKIDQENEYLIFGFSFRQIETLKNFFFTLRDLNKKVKTVFFPIPQKLGNLLWNRFHLVNIETLLKDIDVYHSSDWLQLPAKRAKKVTTVHDLVIYKYPEISHPYILDTQKRRLHWVKQECEKIFCDSYATKYDLMTILHFEEKKLVVVYPGIGKIYKEQNQKEIIRVKQKYELLDEYILFVGTDEPRKNLGKLILAFEKFLHHPLIYSRKNPPKLVIVGKKGWGSQVERIKNKKYIKKLGIVDKNDMPALYSGASFFVYPSLYEGFGFPVLEAMACGCPVITSDRGSLKEIATEAALLVDPEMEDDIAVKMTKLLIDESLRKELEKKGKERAAKFSWEETASRILAVYRSLKEEKL